MLERPWRDRENDRDRIVMTSGGESSTGEEFANPAQEELKKLRSDEGHSPSLFQPGLELLSL